MENFSPESQQLYEILKSETAEIYEAKFAAYKKESLDAVKLFVNDTTSQIKELSSSVASIKDSFAQGLEEAKLSLGSEIANLTAVVDRVINTSSSRSPADPSARPHGAPALGATGPIGRGSATPNRGPTYASPPEGGTNSRPHNCSSSTNFDSCNANHNSSDPRVELPQFDGTNPKLWQRRCEEYFQRWNSPQELWISYGSPQFIGATATWLEAYTRAGVKQALISLSDKTDLANLGRALQSLGFSIISTGGTASSLEAAGVNVTKVEQSTHFPEMLDGRVKTLHPSIHGGILARRDQEHHLKALNKHGIETFDVVVVNLYPFYDKVTSGAISFEDGIENIDIGGPRMIRAAAKNHKDVLVVVDHNDYPALLDHLQGKQDDQQFRRMLVWKAFQHCASYDSAVSEWLWKQSNKEDIFPPSFTVPLTLKSTLRYGENPHQKAAFYGDNSLSVYNAGGIATAVQHHGKEMSYNNYLDADAAWNCVSEFENPTCVVVKHTNPCGVASRQDVLEAYRLAVKGDPVSAFGGIVAFNTIIDEDLAKEIREFRSPTDGETRMFYEIVVAPGYTEKGLQVLKGKSKTLRILEAKRSGKGMLSLRQVSGGWLAQGSDDLAPEDITFTTVSQKAPTDSELSDAKFAWLCVKHVKSNAIVIAKNNCMLGMGSGQPNRVDSLRLAFRKAGEEAKGAALASDAFFPFAWKDAVEEACENGIGVIAEPGGSMRDTDAIDCCDKYGVSLVFTGVRHFRH